MVTKVVEIKYEGAEHVAYYHGKEISRSRNLLKVINKLAKYIKGQS